MVYARLRLFKFHQHRVEQFLFFLQVLFVFHISSPGRFTFQPRSVSVKNFGDQFCLLRG